MPTSRTDVPPLRNYAADAARDRFFWGRSGQVCVADLARNTGLGGNLQSLAGKSVVLATKSQLTAGLAMIELDGVAQRLLILPPDIDPDHLGPVIARAEADAIVIDDGSPDNEALALPVRVRCVPKLLPLEWRPAAPVQTEWVLLTSGTTGVPKTVVHSLAALTAPMAGAAAKPGVVWATFYDIRRYGGLQIFLRAVLGRASLVLSDAGEAVADHLDRLGRHGVTHLSGTPSHWRRALMSPAIGKIAPGYVRMSGEIADQATIDRLVATFPEASVGHAYASTEAGVAFEVNDRLAGFPAAFVGPARDGVELKVVDGSLCIRSPRAATRYLGETAASLAGADGFIDTGDIVELRADRYFFAGRKGGIINIGGLKVHPEEIEAVLNSHPQVQMSLVKPRLSPITGAIVVADVVLRPGYGQTTAQATVKNELMQLCRDALPRHKVPAIINIVASLDVAQSGKLARRYG